MVSAASLLSFEQELTLTHESVFELVRRMREDGADRSAILTELALLAEKLSGPRSTASILVLDEEGLLRNGASPHLPSDYLAAIDRIRPNANVGTCASAAATGQIVITTDFFSDNKWAELRQLPLGLGYVAAWSVPLKSRAGKVLGTFGVYFRDKRGPTTEECEGMIVLAKAASLILQ